MTTTIDTAPRTTREDLDFLEQAGIARDLDPRPSRMRVLLLAAALLLAGGTGAFAAMFSSGAVPGSAAYQAGATQCPMTGSTSGSGSGGATGGAASGN